MAMMRFAEIRRAVARCVAALAALIALIQPAPAEATVRVNLSFYSTVALQQGQFGGIGTGVDFFGDYGVRESYECCYSVDPALPPSPATIRAVFSGFDTVSQMYFIGVTSARDHLVMALDTAFSATLVNKEFGSVFTGFSEAQVISDLFTQFSSTATFDQRQAAQGRISDFQNKIFDLNAGFSPSGTFILTSFSRGVVVGSGSASLIANSVPEPASWITMIVGFSLVGGALRRRPGLPATSKLARCWCPLRRFG